MQSSDMRFGAGQVFRSHPASHDFRSTRQLFLGPLRGNLLRLAAGAGLCRGIPVGRDGLSGADAACLLRRGRRLNLFRFREAVVIGAFTPDFDGAPGEEG